MPLPDHTEYRHLVDDPTLTDEQKDEMILTVWRIMSKLVDAIYDGTLDDPPAQRAPTPDIKQRNFGVLHASAKSANYRDPKRDRTA